MRLFDIKTEKKELHPNFVVTSKDPYKVEVLESWFSDELSKRDGTEKFIKEFQKTFNSTLWELYCYQVFKKMGAKFEFNYNHPDFVIELNEEKINIECTIANNAQGTPPESSMQDRLKPKSLDDIVYDQTIRLSNAFNSKERKYLDSYSNKKWVIGYPFIIAIEPFDQPNFMVTGTEAIRLLLYGLQFDHINNKHMKINNLLKKKHPPVVLEMGMFTNCKHADISGVLFSNTATAGKVDAIGNNHNLTFGQLRYNLKYSKPLIRYDSRLVSNNLDSRCKAVKMFAKQHQNERNKFTFRKPLIKWGTDYHEDIVDGLTLFLNPYANYPVSNNIIQLLKDNGVNIVSYDLKQNKDVWDVHDGSLIQRTVNSTHLNYINNYHRLRI